MLKLILASAFACAALAATAFAQGGTRTRSNATLIRAARVLDVRAGVYLRDQGVLVEGGRITRVGGFAELFRSRPRGAAVMDLGRATLMPGLIDAHTHLFSLYDGRVDTTARMDAAGRMRVASRAAGEVLRAGFTTVRDLGGSGGAGDVALRDAIEAGRTSGPRVLAATRKLTPPGGQGENLPRQTVEREFLEVSGPEGARRAVRRAVAGGADVIKVVVNAGPRTLSKEEVAAVVEEARRAGRKVAAHATSRQAVANAVEAGVDSVEHGGGADEELLRRMRERGVSLVLNVHTERTLREIFASELRRVPADAADFEAYVKHTTEQTPRLLRQALAAGVRVVAGSDVIQIYPGRTRGEAALLELEALESFGLPTAEVLRAATVRAAELLGLQDSIGAVEPGKLADLVALDGDPLEGVAALRRVKFVMRGGRVVRYDTPRNRRRG